MEYGGEKLVYRVNERPRSSRDWVLYGFQWFVTMFYAVVLGYAIVGVGLGFEGERLAAYMTAVVLTTGVSTLIQAWRGHGFAMVSGPNIVPSIAILSAVAAGGADYALEAFAAQAIGGLIVAALALAGVLNLIRRVWSPLVLGATILLIGIAVARQGVGLLVADGFGWPFWVGMLLAVGGIVLGIRGRGVWATLPPLFIVGLGYPIFMLAGKFEWSLVGEAPLIVVPSLFPYGLSVPPLDLVIIMTVVNLIVALSVYGIVTGYGEFVEEEVGEQKIRRTLTLFGLVENVLPGILGAPATVPYGENLGIVVITRIAARVFILVAAVAFVVLAFFGPVGAFMAAMPDPVAGAVLLGIASATVGLGISIMASAPAFERREQALVGFAIFLSVGLFTLPEEVWEAVPRFLSTIFSNPIVSVILFVIFFEQVLFREQARHKATGGLSEPGD